MTRDRRAARLDRFEVERALAPHVDPEWAEAAILELRLLGVAGDRIGAALAEVDAHCLDSGEPAAEAFGDPVAYARSLDLPAEDASRRGVLLAALPPLLQVLGMLVALAGVTALRRDTSLEITTGVAAMVAMLLVCVAIVALRDTAVLRLLIHHPLVAGVALALAVGTMAAVAALGSGTLVALPAVPGLVVGVATLAAATAWSRRRHEADESPLVAPTGPTPAWRGARLTRLLTIWQVPATAVLLGAVAWFLA
ncbi:hypothetical protein [Actinotalea fermentans]|uniref:Uncharacterized protein n=1 Tax=Actinotalea fermentans TaxID=43671 RepID=A0A511YYU9_9CELL|nr:hypothetical protein [Actinotalea fermentans]KGM15119.1 hypothetical protein N867_11855 [Actinotalea fermentans ATCC 43279 = JCM 9966 = DSM 3133]GEN80369.1 hypothetical protein AFE02nite_21030 [Actinotalea fermentans]